MAKVSQAKYLLLFLLVVFSFLFVRATTYTTISNGNWSNPNTWDANGSPGTYWGADDQVVIAHDVHLNQSIGYAGSMTIQSSAFLYTTSNNLAVYNGGSINAQGKLQLNSYTLNGNTSAIHASEVDLNGSFTIGSNSTATFNDTVSINGNFTNNNGTVIFNNSLDIDGFLRNNNGQLTLNGETSVNGDLANNNSSADIYVNNELNVNGNMQNNSGARLHIDNTATINLNGNFSNNSSSTVNIDGRFNIGGNMANNGGTVNADGVVDVSGNLTQNGGVYNNNGVTLVEGTTTVNGPGPMNGTGLLRTNDLINYGSIAGTIDICNLDDTAMPSQVGGGNYDPTVTYCNESASAALPVELNFFNAESKSGMIYFKWETLSEVNSDKFIIEFSKDGNIFNPIAEIKAAGNSNKPLDYQYTHTASNKQTNGYYRLKQIDFDGRFNNYSPIFIKHNSLAEKINVYPNPVQNQLFVEFEGVESGEYHIALHDSKGKLIISSIEEISNETIYFETEILKRNKLESGFYFLRISSSTDRFLKKIIVE